MYNFLNNLKMKKLTYEDRVFSKSHITSKVTEQEFEPKETGL